MDSPIQVYVGGSGVLVERGGTALDAVRASSPEDAARVAAGELLITDSRGLPIPAEERAYDGAIYRIVRNRTGEVTA